MVSSKEYKTDSLESDASGVVIAKTDFSASSSDIVFLRLTLRQSSGETLGECFYWHNRRAYQDYHALNSLPEAEVEISSVNQEPLPDGNLRYTLTLKNDSGVPCIQLRVRTLDTSGADVLPVFYSDNYFALLPGETKTITAELHPNRRSSVPPRFVLGGWNTKQA
jgi:hypothetical protein